VRLDATALGRTIRVEVREQDGRYHLELDGTPMVVDLVETGDHFASLVVGGESHEVGLVPTPDGYRVHVGAHSVVVRVQDAARGATAPTSRDEGPARVVAPMPGRVVRVLTAAGRTVEPGEGLVVVEAMKMENELRSPRGGAVTEVKVEEGQAVEAGALLVVVS